MKGFENFLNNIVKKDFDGCEYIKVLILHNKKDNYPLVHVLYSFIKKKFQGKDLIALKYYPLIFFKNKDNYKILLGNIKVKSFENYFQVILNHNTKSAVLNSGGDGFAIKPEYLMNFGLGSFAFHQILSFIKKEGFGSYCLNKQTIGGDEKFAYSRFMFYLKHGLSLSSQAVKTEGKQGEYYASSLLNLSTNIPENILFDFSICEYDNFLSVYNNKLKDELISGV